MGSRKRIHRGLLVGGLLLILASADAQWIKLNNIERSKETYVYHPIYGPYANYVGLTDSFGVQRYAHIDSIGELMQIGGGMDSIFFGADSICLQYYGDTICAELDSFYFDMPEEEICFIIDGVAECYPFDGGLDVSIYTHDGIITGTFITRWVETAGNTLSFTRNGVTVIRINNTAGGQGIAAGGTNASSVSIWNHNASDVMPMLGFKNTHATGDNFNTFIDDVAPSYAYGLSKTTGAWTIAEGHDIGGTGGDGSPMARFHATGDSIFFRGLVNIRQTDALNNIFISGGSQSVSGTNNISMGPRSAEDVTTGTGNTLIGYNAGDGITTGDSNVIIGHVAGDAAANGNWDRNVYIGAGAGGNNGDGNVFIGCNVGSGITNQNNQLKIDNSSTSTPLINGDFASNWIQFNGLTMNRMGSSVASATDLVAFSSGGNSFHVTGTTTINDIVNIGGTQFIPGAVIRLIFDGNVTVTHNGTPGTNTDEILLDSGLDFAATANDVLTLIYDTGRWLECGRTVIP